MNLFYLSPNTTGGWVTFTYHLVQALESVGLRPRLFKIGNSTEDRLRDFGYGLQYQNISEDLALQFTATEPSLIAAVAKTKADVAESLILEGAKIVVHDPTEVKNLPEFLEGKDVVVIRKTGLDFWPDATYIPHPYKRFSSSPAVKKSRAISTSRIDFDKNTTIILDANRLGAGIVIRGFENRLYTRFKVCPNYPEWRQSVAAYPREADAAFKMLQEFHYMVDMSVIKGDGGGTQYTTLEAWDAECFPIIHEDWIIPGHEMVDHVNCVAVRDGKSLWERTLAIPPLGVDYASFLLPHSPEVVGSAYKKFLLA